MSPEEALAAVALFAVDNPEFLRDWEAGVRDAADSVTALIAGSRMAGKTEGSVAVRAVIPVPETMSFEDAERAFWHKANAVARERLEKMENRGGPG